MYLNEEQFYKILSSLSYAEKSFLIKEINNKCKDCGHLDIFHYNDGYDYYCEVCNKCSKTI